MANETKHASNINSKIKKAITKLRTLDSIRVTKALTSNYRYTTDPPSILDRFDVTIQTKDSDQDLFCKHFDRQYGFRTNFTVIGQIVLDSNDYNFPPDLIFKKSTSNLIREIKDSSELLPSEGWDLNDENCLYDWFAKILEKKEKWCSVEDKQQNDKMWDIFDDDDGNTLSKEKGKAPENSSTASKTEKDKASSTTKSFPIFNKGKRKVESSDDEELSDFEFKRTAKAAKLAKPSKLSTRDTREYRENFVRFWINKYRSHIVQYDSVNFRNLALYMTFTIPKDSPLWEEYRKAKTEAIEELKTRRPNAKIPQPKPVAPMIVNFDLNNSRTLKITLLSVANTLDYKSSCPDSIDLEYKLDFSQSVPDLARYLERYIHELCIKFHLQQTL